MINQKKQFSDIVALLLEYFTSNEIHPGDRLPPERHMSEQFGISRAALREALKTLQLLGLINVRQGDGYYLNKPKSMLLPAVVEWSLLLGEARVSDIMEARQKIEVDIAELAAIRRGGEELDQLKSILSIMKENMNDKNEYVLQDVEFHLTLAKASRNNILFEILSNIQTLLKAWIKSTVDGMESLESSYNEHLAIFKAVEAGNKEEAIATMEKHMESVSVHLNKVRNEDLYI